MAQLCHLVEYFIHDCYVFIHLDKKFKMSKEERERLEAFPQVVRVYQEFDVNWGGFSMPRCQISMMSEVNFFPDPLLNRQLKELNMGNKKYVIFVKKK